MEYDERAHVPKVWIGVADEVRFDKTDSCRFTMIPYAVADKSPGTVEYRTIRRDYEEAVEVLNQAIEVNIELEDFKSQSKNINSIGART